LYDWVLSFDVASLYPHLIWMLNLGPDTLKGKYKNFPDIDELVAGAAFDPQEFAVAASGVLFSKEKQSFMGALIVEMLGLRKVYKDQMLEAKKDYEKDKSPENNQRVAMLKAKEKAIKILMNSLYGAMCNQYFRFFSLDVAMSITLSGQFTIKLVEQRFNAYMNKVLGTDGVDYIIASDTDSIYVNAGPIIKKFMPTEKDTQKITNFLDAFCERKAQKVIDSAFVELYEKLNVYAPCLKMKREAIAERGIWTGKKRYIVKLLDNEGVRFAEPEMKYTGIEVVRSSVPEVCRDALKEALTIIMNKTEDDLILYVESFRAKFRKMSFYQIASPRGINGLKEYADTITIFKKGCPIHVRGALVYNHFIKTKKLTHKYELIKDADKIKFCYLKLPNRLMSNVIATSSRVPEEMKLEELIDYETQFEKTFVEPLNNILTVIGWNLEKEHTLAELFN
jgi:DNA polymerase elongation subunit (family B)